MKVKTVADLKRLPIGTKIKLVSFKKGDIEVDHKLKGIERVICYMDTKNMVLGLDVSVGRKGSYMEYPKASDFFPIDNGFIVASDFGGILTYNFCN